MGAAASSDAASDEQLERMRALLVRGDRRRRSRLLDRERRDAGRRRRPSDAAELRDRATSSSGLSEVCGWHPGTSIEFIPDSFLRGFSDDDIELMADMSAAANRAPQLEHAAREQDRARPLPAAADGIRRRGGTRRPRRADVHAAERAQPAGLPARRTCSARCRDGVGSSTSSVDERIDALQQPEVRERLRAALDAETVGLAVSASARRGVSYFVNEPADPALQHLQGRRVGDIARERGVSDFDAALDIAVAARLDVGFVRYPYADDDAWSAAARVDVLRDPRVVLGASDAGAHMDMMVRRRLPDAVSGRAGAGEGRLLARGARAPAHRGARSSLRSARPRHAHRGRLRRHRGARPRQGRGRAAPHDPRPSRRCTAARHRIRGIHRVLVAGTEIAVDGEITDARPGQLIRSGRDTETVAARSEV